MDAVKERMAKQDKDLTIKLEKTIAAKTASEEERINAVREMAQLYKKYGYNVEL